MTTALFVALGGGVGALVHSYFTRWATNPRRVVLTVAAACASLGFVTAALPRTLTEVSPRLLVNASPEWVVGLVCFGFLGALAPVTSVALIVVGRVRERRYRSATLFLLATVVGGIACAMLGILLYTSGVTLYRKF